MHGAAVCAGESDCVCRREPEGKCSTGAATISVDCCPGYTINATRDACVPAPDFCRTEGTSCRVDKDCCSNRCLIDGCQGTCEAK